MMTIFDIRTQQNPPVGKSKIKCTSLKRTRSAKFGNISGKD